MRFSEVARASGEVASTRSRLKKFETIATLLRALAPDEIAIAVAYLSGELPRGSIGVGWATLRDQPGPAALPSLEILDVDASLSRVANTTGPGSRDVRKRELNSLFEHATEPERRFLMGLLVGELRQGALEGIMIEAVARAASVPAPDVRRAVMLAGDVPTVAQAALVGGIDALSAFRLTLLTPVKPMLASSAETLEEALDRVSAPALEWKFDGARVQVHRAGDEVRVFTRNLLDATERVPEIVGSIGALELESVILDGEAISLRTDSTPLPFQDSMSRFGSTPSSQPSSTLASFYFDCLHLNGEDLIDRTAEERFAALRSALPEEMVVPRLVPASPDAARSFFEDAVARGHEGVMVKGLDAPYEAGRRGASWIKVKPAHTFDLVVLAAEWGHGRRKGWLSNLHLGARDPEGGFVMVGKTFKGMTDEVLAWQTERLQSIQERTEGIVVYVRPELVVEVAIDGVQRSTRYPGGIALRFARIKGYRPDKGPADADTIESVKALQR